MAGKNYTPIDRLIKKTPPGAVSFPKEMAPAKSAETPNLLEKQELFSQQPTNNQSPIQIRPTSIKLPPDLKKLGLRPVDNEKLPRYASIKLPIADDKILPGLHAPITSSLRWLATLAIYLLRRAHLGLKIIHGHVVRVIKT